MATKKRKTGSDTIRDIKDLLVSTKSQLESDKESATKSLWRLGTLAEQLSCGSGVLEEEMRDWLDQEGVNLWNLSSLPMMKPVDTNGKSDAQGELVGALRHAAFRLIEAGLEPRPAIDSLLHVLQIASKTGATLAETGRSDKAGVVLSSAAKWEELVRTAKDGEKAGEGIEKKKAGASVVYLSCRMDAAAKEGNFTVAEFMAQKITGDEARLSLVSQHDRIVLAVKLHDIGRMVLKGCTPSGNASKRADVHAHTPQEAVGWLQKAFSVADHGNKDDDDAEAAPGKEKEDALKLSILRTLARAYFLSGSHDRAEATLDELMKDVDGTKTFDDATNYQYQELRWLRLAILKRRGAGDGALLEAFKSIIDHIDMSEAKLTDVLQDLRTISHQQVLVSSVHLHCLKRALASTQQSKGDSLADRLLLSLIVHCSKDEDHTRAMGLLSEAFTCVRDADYELPAIPATACLTLLWQYGDRQYQAKRFSNSADWFLAGSHPLFPVRGIAKCFRKAALCYNENREYAKACAILRKCDAREAKTQYVRFLVAVGQGIDDEAIKAVQEMTTCPDFDKKMLLLATQVSHASENRTILLAALKALLRTMKSDQGGSEGGLVEAMTLIRCIIKLVLRLLTEPAANRPVLIDTIIDHLRICKVFVTTAQKEKTIHLITKDLSWLWRTAYNCAVQGCSEWEACEERISDLFDVARDMIEISCEASPVDVDVDVYMHLAITSFSGAAGRVFALRQDEASSVEATRKIAEELKSCRTRIEGISAKGVFTDDNDVARIEYFVHTLRVFEVEMLAKMGEWNEVALVVDDAVSAGQLATSTYEAIADILWVEKDCPVKVLYASLEAILRASLDHNSMSVDKFSRWLRAICTIILARNSAADRVKAIGYVEQAVGVIEQSDDTYPVDERFWLLSTAYNVGVECFEASALDEAKRWIEASTMLCRYVPGGVERAEKISETYARLLERYVPN